MKRINTYILFIVAITLTSNAIAQKKTVTVKSKPILKSETKISIDNGDSSNGESDINYRDSGGHSYHFNLKNDVVTNLSVDGKVIPEKDYPKYDATIKKIKEEIKKDREEAELDRQQAVKDQEEAEKDRVEAEKDQQEAIEEQKQAEIEREHAQEDMKQAELDRKQAELDRKQAEVDRKQAEVDRKLAEEDRRIFKGLVADLIDAKVISSEEKLFSLKVTNTNLIVNGVKKSASLQQKLKTKYLVGKHTEVNYYSNNRGSGMTYQ